MKSIIKPDQELFDNDNTLETIQQAINQIDVLLEDLKANRTKDIHEISESIVEYTEAEEEKLIKQKNELKNLITFFQKQAERIPHYEEEYMKATQELTALLTESSNPPEAETTEERIQKITVRSKEIHRLNRRLRRYGQILEAVDREGGAGEIMSIKGTYRQKIKTFFGKEGSTKEKIEEERGLAPTVDEKRLIKALTGLSDSEIQKIVDSKEYKSQKEEFNRNEAKLVKSDLPASNKEYARIAFALTVGIKDPEQRRIAQKAAIYLHYFNTKKQDVIGQNRAFYLGIVGRQYHGSDIEASKRRFVDQTSARKTADSPDLSEDDLVRSHAFLGFNKYEIIKYILDGDANNAIVYLSSTALVSAIGKGKLDGICDKEVLAKYIETNTFNHMFNGIKRNPNGNWHLDSSIPNREKIEEIIKAEMKVIAAELVPIINQMAVLHGYNINVVNAYPQALGIRVNTHERIVETELDKNEAILRYSKMLISRAKTIIEENNKKNADALYGETGKQYKRQSRSALLRADEHKKELPLLPLAQQIVDEYAMLEKEEKENIETRNSLEKELHELDKLEQDVKKAFEFREEATKAEKELTEELKTIGWRGRSTKGNKKEDIEARLRTSAQPASAVCTMTLELGIDIGSVDSIAQLSAAQSVASMRQRLGRSGRRGNGKPARPA